MVSLLVISGLTLLVSSMDSQRSAATSTPDALNQNLYNVTFVANGLENIFPGSDVWALFFWNVSSGAVPLNPTGNTGYLLVPAGTYFFEASDYFQINFASPDYVVSSNMTIYVNFTPPQSVTFNAGLLNNNTQWGVDFTTYSGNVYIPPLTSNSSLAAYAIPGEYTYSWYTLFNGFKTTVNSQLFYIGAYNVSINLPVNGISNVTFNENGLPAGTQWFVKQQYGAYVSSGAQNTSTGPSLQLSVMSGINTFIYGYVSNGQNISVNTATVYVSQKGSAVSLNFPHIYAVNFSASNFPSISGILAWGVNITFNENGLANSLSVGTLIQPIQVYLPNATLLVTPYLFLGNSTGGTENTGYMTSYGMFSMQVQGHDVNKAVSLGPLNKVSLSVMGIPAGTSWSLLSLSSSLAYYYDNGTSNFTAYFYAVNGTYSFVLQVLQGGSPIEDIPVSATANGMQNSNTVTLYNTSFGNPYSKGKLYMEVYSSDYTYNYGYSFESPSAGLAVSALLPNGTYQFMVSSSVSEGYGNINDNYNVTLSVNSANQTLSLFPPLYSVQLTVTGLPSSTPWDVQFMKGQNQYAGEYQGIGNGTFELNMSLGDYTVFLYQLSQSGSTFYSANATAFTVTPYTNLVNMNYHPYGYTSFVSYGLSPGTSWSVTLNGTTVTSTQPVISIKSPKINLITLYNYSIGTVPGYVSTPSVGSYQYQPDSTGQVIIPVTFTQLNLHKQLTRMKSVDLATGKVKSNPNFTLNPNGGSSFSVSDKSLGVTAVGYSSSGSSLYSSIKMLNSSTYSLVKTVMLPKYGRVTSMVENTSSGTVFFALSIDSHFYLGSLSLANYHLRLMPFLYGSITGMLMTPTGLLYVGNSTGILAVDQSTFTVSNFIEVPHDGYLRSVSLVYSQTNNLVYAIGYYGTSVLAINPVTNALVGSYNISMPSGYYVEPLYSAYDATNNMIYITAQTGNFNFTVYGNTEVLAFNPATGSFHTVIRTLQGVSSSIFSDPQNGMVYISSNLLDASNATFNNLGFGLLTEFDPATGSVVNTLETGISTVGASYNPTTGDVLVTGPAENLYVLSTGAFGHLAGNLNVQGATLLVDGYNVPLSNGNFNLSLAPGTYYLTADAMNYAPVVQSVTVTAYETTTVSLTMNRTGTYQVYGQVWPGTASVTLDGMSADVNQTGHYSIYVTPGVYTISFYKPGYFPVSEIVNTTIGPKEMNATLLKEPAPTSQTTLGNVSVQGFNTQVTNLSEVSGKLSLDFNSTGNGTITIEVPYTSLTGTNLTDLLHSRLYIGGVQYTNFTVSVSSNYTIILTVHGLKADPQMVWAFSPSVTVPPPVAPQSNMDLYYIIGGIAAAVVVIGAVFYMRKKEKS